MALRKEREIIKMYVGESFRGGMRMTDGAWIGVKGAVVKGRPQSLGTGVLEDIVRDANTSIEEKALAHAIANVVTILKDNYMGAQTKANYIQKNEMLASVGLYADSIYDMNFDERLTKDLVKFIKDCYRGRVTRQALNEYKVSKNYAILLNDPDMPTWTQEFLNYITTYTNAELPISYLLPAIKRCGMESVREAIWYMMGLSWSNLHRVISDYYTISMTLYDEVKVERNFLTRYGELIALKQKYDEEHYDEQLQKRNDKPALYYEDNTFFIRPLLTKEAFHDEGEQQHNCVERLYMSKVHDSLTHVVQVRRKDNPNKSLITCEVNKRGDIWQWLAFGNSRPGIEYEGLKIAYAKHLKENWE